MGRMIDADELITAFPCGETVRTECVRATIKHMPTIEEHKTGKWIPFDIPWYQCSECGAVRKNVTFMENFCPNCGARMVQEGEDND